MSASILLGLAAVFLLLEITSRGAATKFVWFGTLRLFIATELLAARLMRLLRPPRFALAGTCYKCGSCCRQIVAFPPRLVSESRLLGLFLAFHRVAHGFEPVGRGPHGEIVFSCRRLGQDGRCTIYRRRPFLCRDYPRQPYFVAPKMLPGCGFAAAPRVVARMRHRASLPVLNPGVAVHHPTRDHKGEDDPGDFFWFAGESPSSSAKA